jgi:hypothetical protein
MVGNWPAGASAARASKQGLVPDESFADIIRQYISDCQHTPGAELALKGL